MGGAIPSKLMMRTVDIFEIMYFSFVPAMMLQ
jgi:hypothetical protein